jgi:transposase
MTRREASNALSVALEPSIPVFTPQSKGGRKRSVNERDALSRILYALKTGIARRDLPQESPLP